MFAIKRSARLFDNTASGMSMKISLLLFIFLFLNALKVVLFNIYIMDSNTVLTILYKTTTSIIILAVVYLVLMRLHTPLTFILFYLFQAAYILVNLAYYNYFHSYLHIFQSAVLVSEGMGAVSHFSVPKDPRLLVALLDLPLFIVLVCIYAKITAFNIRLGFFRTFLIVSCLLMIIFGEGWNFIHSYSFFHLVRDYYVNESRIVERYGTLVNSLADISINRSDKELISSFSYGKLLSSDEKRSEKPNFVIVQVESMDSSLIKQQYKGKYVVPFLHDLSQKSVYYPYTMSYHKAGGTSDSEFSIINSMEPLDNFPSIKIANYTYPNSMIGVLAGNSYKTYASHGNAGVFFNRDSAFPKMGFQTFDDIYKMGLKDIGWGAPDRVVFNHTEKTLRKLQQPFVSYTITMTSHGPFTNAGLYYNDTSYSDIPDPVMRNYLNSMSYVDNSLKEFVSFIQSNFENTYIFIWGDHTPSISNNIYRQASFIEGGRYFEFVPLIILTPDNKIYKESMEAASFLDIAPTILKSSGVPYKIRSNGKDLLNLSEKGDKIPFKGGSYDRSYLFNKIKE